MNEPITLLIKEIASLLKESDRQLATSESCTGGLIASYLTELPGSSIWFERGFVTYSNLAKEELLSVPKSLLEEFGAVSEQVALAMATGTLKNSRAEFALSVTGIAGPDGGSVTKPVGTVYLAWASRSMPLHSSAQRKQFSGTRQQIRESASQAALEGLLALIKRKI